MVEEKKTGHEYLDEGKTTHALGAYLSEAENGSLTAMTHLGWMYGSGHGVVKNRSEAERWYCKAIDDGAWAARFFLAMMYLDYHENESAIEQLKISAEENFPPAHYRLGLYYLSGVILEQDLCKGEAHIRKAAELGHLFARRMIAGNMMKGRYGYRKIFPGLFAFLRLMINGIGIMSKDRHDMRLLR